MVSAAIANYHHRLIVCYPSVFKVMREKRENCVRYLMDRFIALLRIALVGKLPPLLSTACVGAGVKREITGGKKRRKKMKAEETKNVYREVNIEQIA